MNTPSPKLKEPKATKPDTTHVTSPDLIEQYLFYFIFLVISQWYLSPHN